MSVRVLNRTSGHRAGTEHDGDGDGGSTETEVLAAVETEEEISLPWNVLVLNDPVNLMSFVTMIIRKIFGYDKAKAEKMMLEVHQNGRSIVWTGPRETAEFYVQQLQQHQLLSRIEKVEG